MSYFRARPSIYCVDLFRWVRDEPDFAGGVTQIVVRIWIFFLNGRLPEVNHSFYRLTSTTWYVGHPLGVLSGENVRQGCAS